MVDYLKLLVCCTLLFISVPIPASQIWDDSEPPLWDSLYIGMVNFMKCGPIDNEGVITAADDFSVSLPLTVRVQVVESLLWTTGVNHVELQYKVEGSTTWHTIQPVYDNPSGSYDFKDHQSMMGSETIKLGMTDVALGATILIRLYAATTGATPYENADKALDTGPEGTNGWSDQCVVRVNLRATTRPSWIP